MQNWLALLIITLCVVALPVVAVEPDAPWSGCIPELLVPAPGAVMDNGRTDHQDEIIWFFDWSDCEGSDIYALEVIWSGATLPVVDRDDLTESRYVHVGQGFVSDANVFDWRWRVRAQTNGAWEDWSSWRTFDVEPPDTDAPQRRTWVPAVFKAPAL